MSPSSCAVPSWPVSSSPSSTPCAPFFPFLVPYFPASHTVLPCDLSRRMLNNYRRSRPPPPSPPHATAFSKSMHQGETGMPQLSHEHVVSTASGTAHNRMLTVTYEKRAMPDTTEGACNNIWRHRHGVASFQAWLHEEPRDCVMSAAHR